MNSLFSDERAEEKGLKKKGGRPWLVVHRCRIDQVRCSANPATHSDIATHSRAGIVTTPIMTVGAVTTGDANTSIYLRITATAQGERAENNESDLQHLLDSIHRSLTFSVFVRPGLNGDAGPGWIGNQCHAPPDSPVLR